MFDGRFNNRRGHHPHLAGKTALVKNHPRDNRSVEAQFDDILLSEGYGWWTFERADFSDLRATGVSVCQQ